MDVDLSAVDAFMAALVWENPQVAWKEGELEEIRRRIMEEGKLEITGKLFNRHALFLLPGP